MPTTAIRPPVVLLSMLCEKLMSVFTICSCPSKCDIT